MKSYWKVILEILKQWVLTGSLKLSNLKTIVIKYLKSAAIKAALLQFLGSTIAGGWKAWLIKFIVTELFEEVAEPLVKYFFRKIGYVYDRVEGEIKFNRIKEAKENNDKISYNIAVDDVFK